MDRQSIYTTRTYNSNFDDAGDTRLQLQTDLEEFILDFRLDNHYVYRFVFVLDQTSLLHVTHRMLRDQLRENALLKKYFCDINIGHLISYNEELAHRLATEPAELIPLVSCTYIPLGSLY